MVTISTIPPSGERQHVEAKECSFWSPWGLLVAERILRGAPSNAGIPYAIIGCNAVAAWVATIDDGAVRNTRGIECQTEGSPAATNRKLHVQVSHCSLFSELPQE